MKAQKFTSLFLLLGAVGCASQLAISEMNISPADLNVGDRGLITVRFVGPMNVASVRAIVREAPDVFYELHDDGSNGDEKANDNVWMAVALVPPEAEPGLYHLDVKATDAEGNAVAIEGGAVDDAGYSGSIAVTVN